MFTQKDFTDYLNQVEEIGMVSQVTHSITYISGLPNAKPAEVIIFETGGFGQILSLSHDFAEALIFSDGQKVKVGTRVTRTNQLLEIPVGEELLGQTLNPLGRALSLSQLKKPSYLRHVETPAPGIDERKRVKRPLETGVTMVDMIIPLGKGQRELIIGDRKTGKTNFLLQTALMQARQGTICIYAAIGKKRFDIKKVEEFFAKNNILEHVVLVASSSQDPAGIIYLTPYTAMSIAEYFKNQGHDVLIILDDLSTHAKFYREISLLGRRFPGRNSYPGDIFYTHARLLERAGNFITKNGESSITCLPVVETTQGDLSGYIQTNTMSMTDGHIYFDSDLFAKGRRPAINPFLSVTRVGHQTQSKIKREINRELTSFLTLFEKMQGFVHFGAELSETIKTTFSTGERIFAFFEQTAHNVIPANLGTFLFCLIWAGVFNDKGLEEMKKEIQNLIKAYENEEVRKKIDKLVEEALSFNDLLNAIGGRSDLLLKDLKVKYD